MHRTHAAHEVSWTPRWLAPRLTLAALVAAVLAAVLWSAETRGQQPPAGAQPPAAKSADKPAKKPRGRLPAYYASVVSPEQRTEIYDIQADFGKQIAKLKQQMESLGKQQDEKVRAVLTEDQRRQVDEKMAAARARRAARRAEPPPNSTSDDA